VGKPGFLVVMKNKVGALFFESTKSGRFCVVQPYPAVRYSLIRSLKLTETGRSSNIVDL
jgi:hypothetical protein